MPDAELRRQKVAYRRGVMRTGAAAAALLALVGSLAFVAFRERDAQVRLSAELTRSIADLKIERGERRLEDGQMAGLLDFTRAIHDLPAGDEQRLLMARWAAWNQRNEGRLVDIIGDEGVAKFAMSSQGTWFATADASGGVQVWRTSDRTRHGPVLHHGTPITNLLFDVPQKMVVTMSADGSVKLWDIESSSLRATLEHPGGVRGAGATRDGRHVVVVERADSGESIVRRWDADTGELVTSTKPYTLVYPALGTDAYLLLVNRNRTGGEVIDTARMASVGEIAFHAPASHLVDDAADVWQAAGFEDGSVAYMQLFLGSDGAPVSDEQQDVAWDSYSVYQAHARPVKLVALSGDGLVIASATIDSSGMVAVLEASTGNPAGRPVRHDAPIDGLVLSFDGTFVAGASGATAHVWSVESGRELTGGLTHAAAITSLAFSRAREPELFVGTSSAVPIRVYRVRLAEASTVVAFYPGGWSTKMALSADGKTLVTTAINGDSAQI